MPLVVRRRLSPTRTRTSNLLAARLLPTVNSAALMAGDLHLQGLLLGDDTLNPTRYLRAEPDGTLRAVHVDEIETDDGTERRHVRACTGADPACAAGGCDRSRWKPVPTPGRPSAA